MINKKAYRFRAMRESGIFIAYEVFAGNLWG